MARGRLVPYRIAEPPPSLQLSKAARDSGRRAEVAAPIAGTRGPAGVLAGPLGARGLLQDIQDDWIDVDPFGAERRDANGVILSHDQLRTLARFFIPAAVIETILTHLREFGRPQQNPYGLGFQVRLRDRERTPTKADKALIAQVQQELYWCGVLRDADDAYSRETLPTLLYKLGRDSLVLDRDFLEIVPDRGGLPAHMRALDGATAKFAWDRQRQVRYAVQVRTNEGGPCAEWKPGKGDGYRARIGIRRPTTEMGFRGYGQSELEVSWQLLMGLHQGFEHNFAFFQHGLTGAGILAFSAKTHRAQLTRLTEYLRTVVAGARNRGRLAVTTYPEDHPPSFIPFANANMKDMEFQDTINFLLKLFCAIYKIDPILIGFQFGNEGQRSALSQGSGKDRIQYGLLKGIWPLARHLVEGIDRYYLQPKYPELEVVPAGLDTETEEERNARDREAVDSGFVTVNEVRKRRDLDELDLTDVDNLADVPKPMQSVWFQLRQFQTNQETAAQGDGDGDEPGPGGGQKPDGGEPPPQAPGGDDYFARMFGEQQQQDHDGEEQTIAKSLYGWVDRGLRDGSIRHRAA